MIGARTGLAIAWLSVGAGGAAVTWGSSASIVAPLEPVGVSPGAAVRPAPDRAPSADSLVAKTVTRPLFRANRRPASIAYDRNRELVAASVPAAVPKPTLLVVGIVDGAMPTAVVEGLPGVEGSRVVRVGDVIAGLKVTRIFEARVTVVGMDTTWVLKVREPWR